MSALAQVADLRVAVGAFTLGVVVALASSGPARAEKVLMSADEMQKLSTHVVVGKVQAVYEYTTKDNSWETWHQVAEVAVEKAEKGTGIEPGQLIYVRYWRRNWIGRGQVPPSTAGHTGMAASGQTARYYLVNKGYDGGGQNTDGGYNVVFRNGCEVLETPATTEK